MIKIAAFTMLSLLAMRVGAYADEHIPLHVGECVETRIERVANRLQDGNSGKYIKGSGSAIIFTNSLYQVSYSQEFTVDKSRRGDPVTVCLIKLAQTYDGKPCPAGDTRGNIYRVVNHRTGYIWELPDAEHMCGGA
jgi:hypothetical protein